MRSEPERANDWRAISLLSLDGAEQMKAAGNPRGCANRAYYAAHQAATAVCIAHGDKVHFPQDWNNPAHDQLPGLIMNNGNFSAETCRRIASHLRFLQTIREDADYRPDITVSETTALECLHRRDYHAHAFRSQTK